MNHEIVGDVLQSPETDRLILYATQLSMALAKSKPDGTCMVQTLGGYYKTTAINLSVRASHICEELKIFGRQDVVDALFPLTKTDINEQTDQQKSFEVFPALPPHTD